LLVQRLTHDSDIPRRLIQAASEVFARHGYSGTRIREIVRAADVNLASVNYYFGGKEGLYAATLQELAAERAAQAPRGRAEDGEMDLHRQVESILRRYVDIDRNSSLGRILAHESMNPTAYFERLVTDIVRPELERLRAAVTTIVGDRLDEATLSRTAMSIMGQCLFYLFARGAVERLYPDYLAKNGVEGLARHIVGFSLGGIAALTRTPVSGRRPST